MYGLCNLGRSFARLGSTDLIPRFDRPLTEDKACAAPPSSVVTFSGCPVSAVSNLRQIRPTASFEGLDFVHSCQCYYPRHEATEAVEFTQTTTATQATLRLREDVDCFLQILIGPIT